MKKRYWLRGGIIGVIAGFVLSLGLLAISLSAHDISDAYGALAEGVFNFFATILLYSALDTGGFPAIESFIISSTYTFLVGCIIGWFYGRMKNRNSDAV